LDNDDNGECLQDLSLAHVPQLDRPSSDADASSMPSSEKATVLTDLNMALKHQQRRSRTCIPKLDDLVAPWRRQ
jgi:hypothetical protein